jgi:ABC-2 type transport system ATP-binding protein
MSQSNAVDIRGVTKTFGQYKAVDDLSLSVPEGSVYGFIGPNGSGKTTTLRMIMHIFHPETGEIDVLGKRREEANTDAVGYLPEERGLYKKMKLRDLLCFYTELKGGQNVKAEVNRWLEKMELSAWADKKVEALSKGMSQKAQFIAAVASRPKLLILDEPFSGLDPVNADLLRESVLELRREGTTIIFSTHDMSTAETMCDFIFMIHKGHKVLDGSLKDIQSHYGEDTVQIELEGDAGFLKTIPGVVSMRDFGQMQEVQLEKGTDPQGILQEALKRDRVKRYEVKEPSLHDIFVRIVKDGVTEEVTNHA